MNVYYDFWDVFQRSVKNNLTRELDNVNKECQKLLNDPDSDKMKNIISKFMNDNTDKLILQILKTRDSYTYNHLYTNVNRWLKIDDNYMISSNVGLLKSIIKSSHKKYVDVEMMLDNIIAYLEDPEKQLNSIINFAVEYNIVAILNSLKDKINLHPKYKQAHGIGLMQIVRRQVQNK